MAHLSTLRALVSALAAAIVVSLSACGGTDSPSDVVEGWLTSIAAGEISHAISLMDPDLVEGIGEQRVQGALRAMSDGMNHPDGESVEVHDEEVRGEMATVMTHAVYADGSFDEMEVTLVLVDGVWRVRPS